MMRVTLAALVLLVGCTSRDAPPAPPPEASLALADTASGPLRAPLPDVSIRDGRSDTLALAALLGTDAATTFPPHPGAEVDEVGDGRIVIRVADDAPRPMLVPVEVGGVDYVLVTRDVPTRTPPVALRAVGLDPSDPSLLVFVAESSDGSPLALDDEDGVALSGNRRMEENALDVHADRLVLDLDAVGPGRRRLRVIAASPDVVSNWAEVEVVDGRPVE